MVITQEELQSIIDLMRYDPVLRRQFQLALEMDPLLALPARQEQFDEKLAQIKEVIADLALAQRQAEARLAGVEERLTRLEQIVEQLVISQRMLHDEVQKVVRWQIGEDGRRKGEQYERSVELRAARLLGGGAGGGLQRDIVYDQVNLLTARLPELLELPDEADPMLADVIWWKDERYAVVEVSLRVDRLDVIRAGQRAETLRRAGVDAIGVVIGEDWVADDTRDLAQEKRVAWKVGGDLSESLLAFRSAGGKNGD